MLAKGGWGGGDAKKKRGCVRTREPTGVCSPPARPPDRPPPPRKLHVESPPTSTTLTPPPLPRRADTAAAARDWAGARGRASRRHARAETHPPARPPSRPRAQRAPDPCRTPSGGVRGTPRQATQNRGPTPTVGRCGSGADAAGKSLPVAPCCRPRPPQAGPSTGRYGCLSAPHPPRGQTRSGVQTTEYTSRAVALRCRRGARPDHGWRCGSRVPASSGRHRHVRGVCPGVCVQDTPRAVECKQTARQVPKSCSQWNT